MSHECVEPTHSIPIFTDSKEIFPIQVEVRHYYFYNHILIIIFSIQVIEVKLVARICICLQIDKSVVRRDMTYLSTKLITKRFLTIDLPSDNDFRH